jgi:hypothetical protein
MRYEFLREAHPVWQANHKEWERRERLLAGGPDVAGSELVRFEWEAEKSPHFEARQKQAVYPGFGEQFLRTLVGHVLRARPTEDGGLSFGAMGMVGRAEGQAVESQAEQVFFNVDGTGGDGQQWWQWISSVFQRAGATGLRWVLVEAPRSERRSFSRRDELDGMRPYAVEFSPVAMRNWRYERGRLMWCVIDLREDTRRVADGKVVGKANDAVTYLLVRRGATDLGPEFEGGGWWRFDADGNLADGIANGTWDRTNGEIPIAPAVWEWNHAPSDGRPVPLARSATTSLDNLSVAYMNMVSAWRSNGWRAAGAPDFLLGVSSDQWESVKEQMHRGHAWIGVPSLGEGDVPQIAHGSAALVTASAFSALLQDMTDEAERMMLAVATSTPDSSGRSKEAGFAESKSPRLTLLAENIESFSNTLLRFFELRFGHPRPTAYVQMPREFDLTPVEEDIRAFVDTLRRTQLSSPTLESTAVLRLGESVGLVSDENRDAIRDELVASAEGRMVANRQEAAAFRDIEDPLGLREVEPPPPPPPSEAV